eukprot:CAMPEP_0182900700 /NCGR_PEP_ID=MMETSP0034_2-20130328/29039_1 /TAXON_ID=156128 /ORGANISM="Nephroselmis pyriformis, Strain CCMP717" /LENGTH=264 /DNA_ID=CAMNT_0025034961 /DNA_START=113 /DNA_END=903 /DNA_ORIENTATION=-
MSALSGKEGSRTKKANIQFTPAAAPPLPRHKHAANGEMELKASNPQCPDFPSSHASRHPSSLDFMAARPHVVDHFPRGPVNNREGRQRVDPQCSLEVASARRPVRHPQEALPLEGLPHLPLAMVAAHVHDVKPRGVPREEVVQDGAEAFARRAPSRGEVHAEDLSLDALQGHGLPLRVKEVREEPLGLRGVRVEDGEHPLQEAHLCGFAAWPLPLCPSPALRLLSSCPSLPLPPCLPFSPCPRAFPLRSAPRERAGGEREGHPA